MREQSVYEALAGAWLALVREGFIDGKSPVTLSCEMRPAAGERAVAVSNVEVFAFQRGGTMVANKFLVSVRGDGKVLIMHPPMAPLSREEAIEFAAWIVALSGGAGDFDDALQEIMAS